MKLTKRISVLLCALTMLACLACPVAVSAEAENTVTLRIEGITENLYYGEVAIPDSASVADAVIAADESDGELTVTGADMGYITAINGDAAGTFGGWDGWLYRVNGLEPTVGITDYVLKAGDEILLFYGDPYGAGMQIPVMDSSAISEGVLAFTSNDVTYDENFNATVSENPVVGMTVIFDETEYVTDENGEITVDAALLIPGEHSVSVSKTGESGIPLVLRLAPDTIVAVAEPTPDEPTIGEPIPDGDTSDGPTDSVPGDSSLTILFVVIGLVAAVGIVFVLKSRK